MPEKNEFSFRVIADLTLENEVGKMTSKPKESRVTLDVSPNLDRLVYTGNDGISRHGLKPATLTLLGGLANLVRMGHKKGWWDKEAHLKYIAEYLREMIDKGQDGGSSIMTDEKFTDPLTKLN